MAKKLYSVADFLTEEERHWFGPIHSFSENHSRVMRVRPVGQTRCPKKGEWYLSGAVVEGYRAKNDLSTPYIIAELVLVEREIVERVVLRGKGC